MNKRLSCVSSAFALALIVAPPCARGDVAQGLVAPSLRPGTPTVTIAGTGRAGNEDGPGDRATFMLPTVVRYGPDGTLYVVDTAGQRIRAISPAGVVSTIAGGGELTPDGLTVVGGYVDGPAAKARFNDPMGLAIAPDGTLYVADTDNHCIRKIAGGIVSTFVGKQSAPGNRNGPAEKATLNNPMGMVFDKDGNLWVADNGSGIRKILPNGRAYTLKLPAKYPTQFTDVAMYEARGIKRLFGAAEFGMMTFDYATRKDNAIPGVYEGSTSIHPFSLLPLAADEVLSADPGWNAIRYLRIASPPEMVYDFSRIVAGSQLYPAAFTGGFRDAVPGESLFSSPTGLALASNGDIAVADAGNRRIRIVPAIDRRHAIAAPIPQTIDHSYFTVVYIANSYAFWNSMWDDSIPGIIERKLNDERTALGIDRPVRVIAARFDGSGITAKLQYIKETLADSGPDMIVWSFNGFDLGAEQQAQKNLSIEQTADYLATTLTDLQKYLSARNTALFAGAQPIGISFSPTEATYGKLTISSWRPMDQTGTYIEGLIEKAVKKSGVPSALTFSAFDDYERSARPVPLYDTIQGGYHFNPAGNAFYAGLLVNALETQKPWAKFPSK